MAKVYDVPADELISKLTEILKTEEIPAPLEYDNPLDEMPVATTEPLDIPTNLKWLSKIKLEEIGRSVGIELDRRLSQPKLVEQLEQYLADRGE